MLTRRAASTGGGSTCAGTGGRHSLGAASSQQLPQLAYKLRSGHGDLHSLYDVFQVDGASCDLALANGYHEGDARFQRTLNLLLGLRVVVVVNLCRDTTAKRGR